MPKKKAVKDEIDLIENIIVVWDKKWYVLLITFFTLIVSFIIQLNQTPSKIIARTEIRPITVYDEAKYQIYNSIINTIKLLLCKRKS